MKLTKEYKIELLFDRRKELDEILFDFKISIVTLISDNREHLKNLDVVIVHLRRL